MTESTVHMCRIYEIAEFSVGFKKRESTMVASLGYGVTPKGQYPEVGTFIRWHYWQKSQQCILFRYILGHQIEGAPRVA